MPTTRRIFLAISVIFFWAPADWLASRPMALPLLKPAERPVLRAVSMCKMERRWSSCASTGSRRRHWPYSASMDNSLTTEIDTRSRHHPMCQFDPNLCPAGTQVEKKIYAHSSEFQALEKFNIRLRKVNSAFKGRTRQGLTHGETDHLRKPSCQEKNTCPPSSLVCPFLSSVVPGAHQTCHGKPLCRKKKVECSQEKAKPCKKLRATLAFMKPLFDSAPACGAIFFLSAFHKGVTFHGRQVCSREVASCKAQL